MIAWITESRLLHDVPERLTDVASWHTHVPFAFWCIEATRPRSFVELGTHRGDSYSAFCQAISRLGLPTVCHAVDTWRGDPQAGAYGDEVFEEWRAFHDPRYSSFSRLVRSTFDDAVGHFPEGSVDLLHIDGLHTYEAVRHDFDTWASRLSTASVVLFHDINVREDGFGAWRFWEEVRRQRPSFSFVHGHGLGVLVWGEAAPEPMKRLASCGPDETAEVRTLFSRLGDAVANRGRVERSEVERRLAQARAEEASVRSEESERRVKVADERLKQAEERLRQALQRVEELSAELVTARTESAVRARRLEGLEAAIREQSAQLASEVGKVNALVTISHEEQTRMRGELVALREELSRQRDRSFGGWLRRLRHTGWVALQMLYWAVTFQLPKGLRRRRYARLIRRARLLDAEFYLAQCENPNRVRRDPIGHYLRVGAHKGLDPNPFFDTSFYLERYPDVVASRKNPLVHYIRYGAREGRATGAGFDTASYLLHNPEVASSGFNPLAHYLHVGAARGLRCLPFRPEEEVFGKEPPALKRYDEREHRNWALVVDHRILTPQEDSGSVRMLALVKLLCEMGLKVTFAGDQPQRRASDEERLLALGVEVVLGKEAIARHLIEEGHRYSLVILSRPEVASRYLALARAHAVWAKVVYDTVDLHWVRLSRAAEVNKDKALLAESDRLRRIELSMTEAADLTFTVTEEERRLLLKAVPAAHVEVIPNIHSVRGRIRPFGARRDLLFIGGYEHRPNVDAVEWFVAEILPLVVRELPEVLFQVVGSKLPDRLRRLASPSVRILGYVPEVAPVFEQSRVFVAPLRYGAGMLGKIGQAIEHGLPVVTTRIGADGIGLIDGESALVAEGAEAFARAVVRLYQDEQLWSRVGENAARLVEERYSPAAVAEKVRRVVGIGVGEEGSGSSAREGRSD